MIRRVHLRMVLAWIVATMAISTAWGDDLPHDIDLLPYIGDHYLLVDDYLRSSRFAWEYDTGAVTGADIFGAFADFDGDGIDDLIWLVDHEVACNGDECDLFVFAPVEAGTEEPVPVDWVFVKRMRVAIERAMFERFAIVGDHIYRLVLRKPEVAAWTEATGGKLGYAAQVYDRPDASGRVTLHDVRIGTYDVNGDGRDEVFVYIDSPDTCYRGDCGGDILEVWPGDEGSPPAWRSIGRLSHLLPNLGIVFSSLSQSYPARFLRAVDESVDGYVTLCAATSALRWEGGSYEPIYVQPDEARNLGCPFLSMADVYSED